MGGHALEFGEKAHAVHPHGMQVAEKRILVTRKAKYAQWNGDTHVDPDHPSVRPSGEFARIVAVLGVDHGSVAELVSVHQFEPLLETADSFHGEHRSEDLPVPDRHSGPNVIE